MELGVEKEKQNMSGKSNSFRRQIGFKEIQELWTSGEILIIHLMQPGIGTSLKEVFSYSNDNIMVQKSSEEFKQWTEISRFRFFCFALFLKIRQKYNKVCLFSKRKPRILLKWKGTQFILGR